MPTLNREYPEGNLVPETNPYIRQKLLPVNLPLTKEQIELIKFLD